MSLKLLNVIGRLLLSDSDDHSSSRTGLAKREGWAGHESIPEVTTAPSGCHSNRNLSYRFLFLTLQSLLRPAALTMSSMCVLLLPLCVAVVPYLTEAEEHRGSAGFLDGQRLRAAQLHQAGPRPEPHHAGRPGHPRPSGSDGFQVSLCVCVCSSLEYSGGFGDVFPGRESQGICLMSVDEAAHVMMM